MIIAKIDKMTNTKHARNIFYIFMNLTFRACLFLVILLNLIIPISHHFAKLSFSFQYILISTHSKCQFSYSKLSSATVKSHFIFFYPHKKLFNFKSNYFKYLYSNTRSHSNTFKMVKSFYSFYLKWSK